MGFPCSNGKRSHDCAGKRRRAGVEGWWRRKRRTALLDNNGCAETMGLELFIERYLDEEVV